MRDGLRGCLYRLAVALVPPLVLLGGLEAALRLGGFGAPSGFFTRLPETGRVATNPRFGERFFPPELAREPVAQDLAQRKPAGTLRIFVLGGSAAMGTPEPGLGFGRMLAVMLEERHPERRFEVVNAAMAAIDSRVVREIAGDAARFEPDLFVIYAGNNEVVGPFGPGSLLGGLPPRPLVGARVALGRLKTRQLVGRLAALLRRRRAPAEWRGMEMFLERRLAADAPELAQVRRRFTANLEAVARTARRAGAGMVLATVAVNLRDSPPFASVHGRDLGAPERQRWQELVRRAEAALGEGTAAAAAELLADAAAIDDGHAGLHFTRGQALLAAGRPAEAAAALVRARDLDVLRFRADSGINEAIRKVAARLELPLVDAERLLAAAPEVPAGIPGGELFWEHAHLNFTGNYRLAAAFLPVAERALGLDPGPRPLPADSSVAARLARTAFDRHAEAVSVYALLRRPPFTAQAGHRPRLAALRRAIGELALRARRERAEDRALFAAALAERPADLRLLERRAAFLEAAEEPLAAAAEWRRLVDRLPGNLAWRTRLGFALAAAGELDAAETELRRVVAAGRRLPDALANLALVTTRRGRGGEAERLYRRALGLQPTHQAAAANLAELLEAGGRAGEAERLLRRAAAEHPAPLPARLALAELLDRQERLEEAVGAYEAVLEEDPFEPRALNNLGYALERLGRLDEAAERYAAAIAADPGFALAHFNLADLLLAAGRYEAAVRLYGAGLTLEPGNAQAARNLERARVARHR